MIRAILLCAVFATAVGDTGTNSTGAVATGTETTGTVTKDTKREVLEFYPDWVPFKNKHGDELGEFVDVVKPKAKVKKRLALPMNFLIKSLTDDDSGDYMGQGESDGEDYFDKRDWQDLNRPVYNVSKPISKEKLSDIDGVINIITQARPTLADEIQKSITRTTVTNQYDDEYETQNRKANITESAEDQTTTMEPELQLPLTPSSKIPLFNNDYEVDSEPSTSTSSPQESEDEQKENEEKKKIILDSVDQLKFRHEQEAKAIAEKNKQDEYDNQLHHRTIKMKKNQNVSHRKRGQTTPPNYDEYEDMSWKDKYTINVEKKPTSTTEEEEEEETTEEPVQIKLTDKTTIKPRVKTDRGKYSVFRNPSLFVDFVDEDEVNNQIKRKKTSKTSKTPQRFSSKYSAAPSKIDSGENYIYPPPVATTTEKTETVEPILYFPKIKNKRKYKKSRTTTTTTTAPDSYVAETVEDNLTTKRTTEPMVYMVTTEDYKTTAFDSDPTSTVSLWKDDSDMITGKVKKSLNKANSYTIVDSTPHNEELTAESIGPSGEAETSQSETVTDAEPASSDHKKEEPKDYHVEKGGGHEYHSSHEEEHEEHGKKAYEGLHKDSKTKKGHHDKEDHLGKYEDEAGHEKKHHDESGHYGEHQHEEHGKKHAKYEESGKHSKGHSTKGSHDIHKKEEYEKNVEFFEEEGDSGEEEKHGGYHNEKEHKAGGQFKKGEHDNEHHERNKGESGHFHKGGHHDVHKGHKVSGGHDSHGKRGHVNHAAGGHQSGKKWVYHHGYPAKNANLIVIDRRTDGYMHGPNYYG